MCGICGGTSDIVTPETMNIMLNSLQHRGPDQAGQAGDELFRIGATRLSMVDLESPPQPLSNETRTIFAALNGEIYNHSALINQLVENGHKFTTRTDTETIVHLYEESGENLTSSLEGMFALAVWDSRERKLVLSRDPIGIKPLYFYHKAQTFLFASELNTLLTSGSVPLQLDVETLSLYLYLGYLPSPYTLFRNIYKLAPGENLIFHYNSGSVHLRKYWSCVPSTDHSLTRDETLERFRSELSRSVEQQLRGDVPIGVFLSGGIDSSTLAYFARENISQKLKTFSIGFEEDSELEDSREFARWLESDHYELTITSSSVLPELESALSFFDEPNSDPAFLPLYFLSRFARQSVKGVLTGEGGDELFAGYRKYTSFARRKFVPSSVASISQRTFTSLPLRTRGMNTFEHYTRSRLESMLADHPLLYPGEIHHFTHLSFPTNIINSLLKQFDLSYKLSPITLTRWIDLSFYLPDLLLAKTDRMTMAASLEARVPFLDHHFVQKAFSIPDRILLQDGLLKSVPRKAMRGLLPDFVLTRPKHGLDVPIDSWTRKHLRPFLEDLIFSSSANNLLHRKRIERLWKLHLEGRIHKGRWFWGLATLLFSLRKYRVSL